jgi:hypothetical protein
MSCTKSCSTTFRCSFTASSSSPRAASRLATQNVVPLLCSPFRHPIEASPPTFDGACAQWTFTMSIETSENTRGMKLGNSTSEQHSKTHRHELAIPRCWCLIFPQVSPLLIFYLRQMRAGRATKCARHGFFVNSPLHFQPSSTYEWSCPRTDSLQYFSC